MADKDYYEIMGVPEAASEDEVRAAFRQLAKKYHPDAHPGDKAAEEKFKDVGEAYEVLGDATKRKKYDDLRKGGVTGISPEMFDQFFRRAEGGKGGGEKPPDAPPPKAGPQRPGAPAPPKAGPQRPGAPAPSPKVGKAKGPATEAGKPGPESFFDELGEEISDWFGQVFKKDKESRTKRGPQAPDPAGQLTREIEVTLKEAVNGAKKPFSFTIDQRCEACFGRGIKPGSETPSCAVCRGLGNVPVSQGELTLSKPCPQCQGRGFLVPSPCDVCGGGGQIQSERKLLINIPAGVEEGQRLIVAEKGPLNPATGKAGDLLLIVQIQEHADFRRDGKDLHSALTINVALAMAGGKVRADTVDGTREITIRPGTQTGAKYRLREHGFRLPDGSRGDQIIEVSVKIPEAATAARKRAVKEFAEELNIDFDIDV